MKSIGKQILSAILFVFILAIILGILSSPSGIVYREEILKVKDESTFNALAKIKKVVNNDKNTSFNNLKEFNIFYNKNIKPSSSQGCYYLKSFNNKGGYIFASGLNSRRYIEEYGEEYFIYKSSDKYIITGEEMKNINQVLSDSFCEW